MLERMPSKTNQQLQAEVDSVLSNCRIHEFDNSDVALIADKFETQTGFDVARFHCEDSDGEILDKGFMAFAYDKDYVAIRLTIGIKSGKPYITK